jgi:BirA family transcriptional regulator, biotin operon repressor / biotin---[acetyl-CoA-carboxylase] ligase
MKLKQFNFKIINSTNNIAIKIIKNTNTKSGIVVAEKQKKGRGQYGKQWISFKGNLFVSIFFTIDSINLTLKQMTKINCFLIKKLLSIYYKGKIEIKRPNDLLINKKKISGILQETLIKTNKNYIIIGVGINLIKSPILKKCPTTNLFELTHIKVDKKDVILNLKKIYERYIPKLSKLNKLNLVKI